MTGRTLLVVGVVLAAGPSTVLAQGLAVGVEAGLADTHVAFSSDERIDGSSDARAAAVVGGVLRYEFGPSGKFALQSGFSRVRKAWEQSLPDPGFAPGGPEGWGWTLDYLELPVVATVRAPVAGPVQFRLLGGGTVSFETGCEFEERSRDTAETYTCESAADSFLYEQPYETRPVDVGFLLGFGFDVGVGPGSFTVDARQARGLTDVSDLEEPFEQETHHRALYLTAGYLVRL